MLTVIGSGIGLSVVEELQTFCQRVPAGKCLNNIRHARVPLQLLNSITVSVNISIIVNICFVDLETELFP